VITRSFDLALKKCGLMDKISRLRRDSLTAASEASKADFQATKVFKINEVKKFVFSHAFVTAIFHNINNEMKLIEGKPWKEKVQFFICLREHLKLLSTQKWLREEAREELIDYIVGLEALIHFCENLANLELTKKPEFDVVFKKFSTWLEQYLLTKNAGTTLDQSELLTQMIGCFLSGPKIKSFMKNTQKPDQACDVQDFLGGIFKKVGADKEGVESAVKEAMAKDNIKAINHHRKACMCFLALGHLTENKTLISHSSIGLAGLNIIQGFNGIFRCAKQASTKLLAMIELTRFGNGVIHLSEILANVHPKHIVKDTACGFLEAIKNIERGIADHNVVIKDNLIKIDPRLVILLDQIGCGLKLLRVENGFFKRPEMCAVQKVSDDVVQFHDLLLKEMQLTEAVGVYLIALKEHMGNIVKHCGVKLQWNMSKDSFKALAEELEKLICTESSNDVLNSVYFLKKVAFTNIYQKIDLKTLFGFLYDRALKLVPELSKHDITPVKIPNLHVLQNSLESYTALRSEVRHFQYDTKLERFAQIVSRVHFVYETFRVQYSNTEILQTLLNQYKAEVANIAGLIKEAAGKHSQELKEAVRKSNAVDMKALETFWKGSNWLFASYDDDYTAFLSKHRGEIEEALKKDRVMEVDFLLHPYMVKDKLEPILANALFKMGSIDSGLGFWDLNPAFVVLEKIEMKEKPDLYILAQMLNFGTIHSEIIVTKKSKKNSVDGDKSNKEAEVELLFTITLSFKRKNKTEINFGKMTFSATCQQASNQSKGTMAAYDAWKKKKKIEDARIDNQARTKEVLMNDIKNEFVLVRKMVVEKLLGKKAGQASERFNKILFEMDEIASQFEAFVKAKGITQEKFLWTSKQILKELNDYLLEATNVDSPFIIDKLNAVVDHVNAEIAKIAEKVKDQKGIIFHPLPNELQWQLSKLGVVVAEGMTEQLCSEIAAAVGEAESEPVAKEKPKNAKAPKGAQPNKTEESSKEDEEDLTIHPANTQAAHALGELSKAMRMEALTKALEVSARAEEAIQKEREIRAKLKAARMKKLDLDSSIESAKKALALLEPNKATAKDGEPLKVSPDIERLTKIKTEKEADLAKVVAEISQLETLLK